MITKLFLKVLEPTYIPEEERSKIVEKTIFRIGRDSDNDWVIVCPNRLISRHHCVIERIRNAFTINDFSKNGVFINNSPIPIGPGNSGILNDGDILNLAGVKISITFNETNDQEEQDPFVALLPSRETGPTKKKPINDPIIAAVTNDKTSEYGFINSPAATQNFPSLKSLPEKFLANNQQSYTNNNNEIDLPPRQIIARSTQLDSPKDPLNLFQARSLTQNSLGNIHSSLNRAAFDTDRTPAEKSTFKSALPQAMTIPEDWDDEELLPSNLRPTKIPPAQNLKTDPMQNQKKLLLKLITEFSNFEKIILGNPQSHILSLLSEQKLNTLNDENLNLSLRLINETASLVNKIVTEKLEEVKSISQTPTNIPVHTEDKLIKSEIDELASIKIDATEQKRTTYIPGTGDETNELE
jgi:predicted component of type VI protein secretion system